MILDAISEVRLGEVHPRLAEKIRRMAEIVALDQPPIKFRVTQGLRSWAEQRALWRKGRDAQGRILDPKAVVTKAAPGHSWHNLGLAVDVVPLGVEGPDWNVRHPAWQRLIEVGISLGLESGALWRTFPDAPHFQLTGSWPISPNDQVRQAYKDGGIEQVWKEAGLETMA